MKDGDFTQGMSTIYLDTKESRHIYVLHLNTHTINQLTRYIAARKYDLSGTHSSTRHSL